MKNRLSMLRSGNGLLRGPWLVAAALAGSFVATLTLSIAAEDGPRLDDAASSRRPQQNQTSPAARIQLSDLSSRRSQTNQAAPAARIQLNDLSHRPPGANRAEPSARIQLGDLSPRKSGSTTSPAKEPLLRTAEGKASETSVPRPQSPLSQGVAESEPQRVTVSDQPAVALEPAKASELQDAISLQPPAAPAIRRSPDDAPELQAEMRPELKRNTTALTLGPEPPIVVRATESSMEAAVAIESPIAVQPEPKAIVRVRVDSAEKTGEKTAETTFEKTLEKTAERSAGDAVPLTPPRGPSLAVESRGERPVIIQRARFQADAGASQEPGEDGADGPFEVIDQAGELNLQVRRSKLLRTKQNVYRNAVVDPSICDVLQFTPRELAIIGRAEGATHVTFWFEGEDQKPLTYLVRVLPDVEAQKKIESEYQLLEDMLADLFPDSKVRLLVMADKLIVKGQAKDAEEAAQIMSIVRGQSSNRVYNNAFNNAGLNITSGFAADVISEEASGQNQRQRIRVVNMLRVPGVQQVALRVKIAELNRSAVRGAGLDIDGTINFSDNPEGSAMFLQSMINVATGDTPALLTQFDGDDIQVGIRWLQQRGVLRLLSEPTLVTMSGKPATFVAGGEFAVPTVVGNVGLNAVTTDFRAFGVIISFLPSVMDKDRIRLQVAPEFSQINNQLQVGDTPGLNVRAVTTTVEMREGQTLAIAGLLEDTMAGNNVGNLPLLSQIFGRRDITRSETELIILVTPELVHPMEPEEVPPLPGFDVTEPNNKEFFLGGHLEGSPTREYRSTVWPRLKRRYGSGGPAMISGPFGHGQ